MVREIECFDCGIAREIEDDREPIEELAERHAAEYGHDVTVQVIDDA